MHAHTSSSEVKTSIYIHDIEKATTLALQSKVLYKFLKHTDNIMHKKAFLIVVERKPSVSKMLILLGKIQRMVCTAIYTKCEYIIYIIDKSI